MNILSLRSNLNQNRELSIRQVEYAEEVLRHPQELKDPERNRQVVKLWLYL